jgi:prepilin-type processing-associated H-X9-DG protein
MVAEEKRPACASPSGAEAMSTCPYCTGSQPPDVAVCPVCGRNLQPAGFTTVRRWQKINLRRAVPFVIVGAIVWGLGSLLWSQVQEAREAARRSSCKCNLKQLGLALHNYHEANGCFPPAWIADSQGRPMHSWRVLILPYIDQAALYNRYNFAEPWDGPNNVKLLSEIPPVYKCPSHVPRTPSVAALFGPFGPLACSTGATVSSAARRKCTNYAAVLGRHCAFRGADPVSIEDITDGTSNTLMIGEVTDADILWTKPEDIDASEHPKIGDRMGFSSDHANGAQFLMGDGSARFIAESVPQTTIDALYTRDGGEKTQQW